jgi:hypothetical protein
LKICSRFRWRFVLLDGKGKCPDVSGEEWEVEEWMDWMGAFLVLAPNWGFKLPNIT